MKTDTNGELENMEHAFARAKREKPAYSHLFPMLEILYNLQLRVRQTLRPPGLRLDPDWVLSQWKRGFPLLQRWDFPIDAESSEVLLEAIGPGIPEENTQLKRVHAALTRSLADIRESRETFWRSFLHHELEPWEEWLEIDDADLPSLLFLARSCLRPSVELVARKIREDFPPPSNWLKGYCPVCGSLPALLYLKGEGERFGYCSWCGTEWGLHRLQCPNCDNRNHETLGYLYIEAEPHYRIPYCSLCGTYFKLVDTREWTEPPYFPLEEWITLHLDLLAQKAGWKPPPSPSPKIYGQEK